MVEDKGSPKVFLKELRQIEKLLVASLIVSGVEARPLAKMLGYKTVSSISKEVPVRRLQKVIPVFRLQVEKPRKKRRRKSRRVQKAQQEVT
jgi:hypothetical protein